jgi:phage baseplate assembly protein W
MSTTNRNFLGTGWRFPVDLDRTGTVSYSHHDDNIRDSIFVILGTAPGERVMRLDFGCSVHDLVFAPNNPTTCALAAHYCEEALMKWEPRIKNVAVKARTAPGEPNKILVEIEYTVVSTNNRRNVVYPFYLQTSEEQR